MRACLLQKCETPRSLCSVRCIKILHPTLKLESNADMTCGGRRCSYHYSSCSALFREKVEFARTFFISVTELVCHVMPRNTPGKNMSMAQHEQRERVHLFVSSIAQLWGQGSGYYGAFPLLLDTPNVNKVRRKPDEMMPKVKDII